MNSCSLPKLNKFTNLCAIYAALLATGCSYSVSLNDRVIYDPPGLFKDYQIADRTLAQCVEQHVVDKKITDPRQLTRLDCSHGGIVSLAGLESFSAIEELNLANNQLTDLTPLSKLSHLRVLILRENPISSIAPLLALLQLQQLDIDETAISDCRDVQQLENNLAGSDYSLQKPPACR
jgi:Leucine-rich repeat (LRR) protein